MAGAACDTPPASVSAAPTRPVPTVSVVLPTRDRPALLEQALQSLTAQEFTDWDAVVVDDGSTPPVNHLGVAARFGPRVALRRHDRSLGGAAAKNTGIRATTAPIIAFLDDDDCYDPRYLARAVELLKDYPDLDGIFMNVAWFAEGETSFGDEHYRAMGRVLATAEGVELERGVMAFGPRLFAALLHTVPMAFQRPVVRREALDTVGTYHPDCLMWDCDWAIRASARLRFALVLDPLYRQRVHRDRTSSRAERKIDHLLSGIEIKDRLSSQGHAFGLDDRQRREAKRSAADDWFSLAYFHCHESGSAWKALHAWLRSEWRMPSLRRATFPARLAYARIAGRPDRLPAWLIRAVAHLIDVNAREHANLRVAIGTPAVVPLLACVIAMRIRRWIRERAAARNLQAAGVLRRVETPAMGGTEAASASGSAERYVECSPPLATDAIQFPATIFQTWKSKAELPEHFACWSDTLTRRNPAYRHVLWDDADNRHFIAASFPWFLQFYDRYPAEIYRADAVRYFFLYRFGGLYADMDTACLRPLDPLFVSADVWLGTMGTDPKFPHSIPNAIMASRPRQEFWLLVIAMLLENARSIDATRTGPETMTGPILLKKAYDAYTGGDPSEVREKIDRVARRLPVHRRPPPRSCRVILLPPEAWYPIDWSNIVHLRFAREATSCNVNLRLMRWLFPASFLVTFWVHSWQIAIGPRDAPRR